MLIKYTIRNNFESGKKSITIPLIEESIPTGDDERDVVYQERQNAIKEFPIVDLETVKYTYPNNLANNGEGLLIQFRFWDTTASTYTTSYKSPGFTNQEISFNRNAFKKSFFRLYFYDSNSGDTNNLIFAEDINVFNTTDTILPFNRLYWLRNDKDFNTNNDKIVYMDAKFFNAKTGKISKFINSYPFGAPPTGPISIIDYSDINNRDWRTSAIKIMNPRNNNGMYNFVPVVPFGANTPNIITLSELIMV